MFERVQYGQDVDCYGAGADEYIITCWPSRRKQPVRQGQAATRYCQWCGAEPGEYHLFDCHRSKTGDPPAQGQGLSPAFTYAIQPQSGNQETAEETPLHPPGPGTSESILLTKTCDSLLGCQNG